MKKPNYKTNDPRGFCGDPRSGAAMGRSTIHKLARAAVVKLYLRKVRLDDGGYDVNGTYFGWGSPLYWYADANGKVDAMTRAIGRDVAKNNIREHYPNARFFR